MTRVYLRYFVIAGALAFAAMRLLSWADKPLPPVAVKHSELGFVNRGYGSAEYKAAYEVSERAVRYGR